MIFDEFKPIDPRCVGCGNIVTQPPMLEIPAMNTCRIYLNPEAKWSHGRCPMCTVQKSKVETESKLIDPIKQSKRKMKGK